MSVCDARERLVGAKSGMYLRLRPEKAYNEIH